jgi:cyclic pyranopterin phosphate synthase
MRLVSNVKRIFVHMEDAQFSHINSSGQAAMVDVTPKVATRRTAKAQAQIDLPAAVMQHMREKELHLPKGPVFQTAILAGIMAAKKTGDLIPLCHPLPLDHISVEIELNDCTATITTEARTEGKTGVEMEALTAASVAALTVYDMCKALSHDIVIRQIQLLEKTGGKRDFHRHA